jgi:hypothetical protein
MNEPKSKKGWRAKIHEMWKRATPVVEDKDSHIDVYYNGEDNMYPYEVERVVNNSPTACRAANLMAKYISGKGLTDPNQNIVVNESKNYKITDILSMAAKDMAYQGGSWIHVGYGLDEETGAVVPKSLDVIEYVECRKAKEDDEDNDGKITVHNYCPDTKKSFNSTSEKKEKKWYYPFNSNPAVIKAQIMKDAEGKTEAEDDDTAFIEAIKFYRGQIFYLNLTPRYKYASPPIDSVYNDADSEARVSVYTNTQVRKGFLGKTVAVTQGLDDEQVDEVGKDLATFLGSENSGDMYHLDVNQTDNIDNTLKFIQLKAQFDDKLFTETDNRIRRNILGAFNNIPEPLVLAGSGALFGTSGEAYEQMKLFYSEQTEEERMTLQRVITMLGFPCEIEPMVKPKEEAVATSGDAQAQAALKSSVGGVTALIELQKSVSGGYTTESAAIAILQNLYGFTEEQAKSMVGKPINTEEQTKEGENTV